jgi:phosphate transport system protein
MSRHLLRDMERIHRDVLSLSSVVEEMIDRATVALCERSDELASAVIQSDTEVDQREVSIEEDCLKMLALHQPVAVDLTADRHRAEGQQRSGANG